MVRLIFSMHCTAQHFPLSLISTKNIYLLSPATLRRITTTRTIAEKASVELEHFLGNTFH